MRSTTGLIKKIQNIVLTELIFAGLFSKRMSVTYLLSATIPAKMGVKKVILYLKTLHLVIPSLAMGTKMIFIHSRCVHT